MKKFFRISYSNGLFCDVPNEQDIPLNQFITNVLMAGYFVNESFYIPAHNINYIAVAQFEDGKVTGFVPRVVN